MTEEFDRRLAAAKARAMAEKQQAENRAATERETAEQVAETVRSAVEQWEKRILPLIKQVVEAANRGIAGAGTRLVVAEDSERIIDMNRPRGGLVGRPFVEIFGSPENKPGATRRSANAPHFRIGVESDGAIAITVPQGTAVQNVTKMLPENVQQKELEGAVAGFVETIL